MARRARGRRGAAGRGKGGGGRTSPSAYPIPQRANPSPASPKVGVTCVSYRRRAEDSSQTAIRDTGADNIALVLQGLLVAGDRVAEAGLSALPRKPKAHRPKPP